MCRRPHVFVNRLAGDAKSCGRDRLVAAGVEDGLHNERSRQRAAASASSTSQPLEGTGAVCEGHDGRTTGVDHESFDSGHELAQVARPRVVLEGVHERVVECGRPVGIAAALRSHGCRVPHQVRDVGRAIAQGRDLYGERTDAIAQVGEESILVDERVESFVGGENEPHVAADGAIAPDWKELAVIFYDVQQLALNELRCLTDFVEE